MPYGKNIFSDEYSVKNPPRSHIHKKFMILAVGIVLYGIFVRFNHLFDHLTADGTCFFGGEVAVIALLEVNADFCGCFHFEFIERFLCFGNEILVIGHNNEIPF